MSLEISLMSNVPPSTDGIKQTPTVPAEQRSTDGQTPTKDPPAAVYTPGAPPSNAGAYFRPAPAPRAFSGSGHIEAAGAT